MGFNGQVQDPYCNEDFWVRYLNQKARSELEACLSDFDNFARTIEDEFRFVMSPNRARVCRTVLEDLIRTKVRSTRDSNQGDLFA